MNNKNTINQINKQTNSLKTHSAVVGSVGITDYHEPPNNTLTMQ